MFCMETHGNLERIRSEKVATTVNSRSSGCEWKERGRVYTSFCQYVLCISKVLYLILASSLFSLYSFVDPSFLFVCFFFVCKMGIKSTF